MKVFRLFQILTFSLAYFFHVSLSAQDSLAGNADELRSLAYEYYKAEDDKNAYAYYDQAMKLYRVKHDSVSWAKCMEYKLWSGYYGELITAENIDAILDEIWWSHDRSAADILRLGGYFLLYRFDRPVQALSYYEKVDSLYLQDTNFLKNPDNRDIIETNVHKPLGRIFSHIGDTENALQFQLPALEYFEETQNKELMGQMCMDIAGTYWDARRIQDALTFTYKGLALKNEITTSTYGGLLANQAQYLSELDSLQKATKVITQAISILNSSGAPGYLYQAFSIKADIAFKEGRYKDAEEAYNEALQIAYSLENPGRQVAKVEIGLADLKFKLQAYNEALRLCQTALSRISPALNPDSICENPNVENIYLENVFIESLELKAQILLKLYYTTNNKQYLICARSSMELVLKVEDLFIQNLFFESSQLQMLEESHNRHEILMEILFLLYQDGDDLARDKMFEVAEKSKGVLLRRAISKRNILINSGEIGKDILRLNEQIFRLKERLSKSELSNDQLTKLNQQLVQLLKLNAEKENELAKTNLAFNRILNADTVIAGVDMIRKTLPNQQSVLIEYFLGKDHIYLLGIDKTSFQVHKVEANAQFDDWIRRFTQKLSSEDDPVASIDYYKEWIADSRYGYETLLQPLLAGRNMTELIIIPDGNLSRVPFDVLLDTDVGQPEKANYKGLPYLLRSANVYYGHTAGLWLHGLQASSSPQWDMNYFGIAPVYDAPHDKLPSVPKSAGFVEKIRQLFSGISLVRNQATSDAFVEAINNYSSKIIHFYGHGKSELDEVYKSHIAFWKQITKDSADQSHLLYDAEIYGLNLQTELFIFSACESGKGKEAVGEGIFHLARSVHSAGAPNTLFSIWKAKDEQNEAIMDLYFDYLKEGKGKSEALRQAKLHYIDKLGGFHDVQKHPFFWGGYMHIGNNTPIELKRSLQLNTWWFVLLGMLVLAGLYRIRALSIKRKI